MATLIGYAAMYFVRIVNSQRIFRFSVNHKKIVFTIVLLVVEACVVCLNVSGWLVIDVLCTLGVVWINREVVGDIYTVLMRILRKI